jgi:hypothetical protein
MDGCLVLSSVNRSRQGQMTLGCESLIQHFVEMEQPALELNSKSVRDERARAPAASKLEEPHFHGKPTGLEQALLCSANCRIGVAPLLPRGGSTDASLRFRPQLVRL